jgi:hypothetical protein
MMGALPEYSIGGRDNVLEEAVKRLKQKKARNSARTRP